MGNGFGIPNAIVHLPGEWPCNGQFHWGSACRMALEWPAPLENFLGEWPWNDHFHWASAWGVAVKCPVPLGICLPNGLRVASSIGESGRGVALAACRKALERPAPLQNLLGGGPRNTQVHWRLPGEWPWNDQFHGEPACRMALGWPAPLQNLLGGGPWNTQFHWHLPGEWPWNDQFHEEPACRMALGWPAPLENLLGELPWDDHFH